MDDSDESEYEIYRAKVRDALPVWFDDLDTAQEFAEDQLDDLEEIEWRFGDRNHMNGLVDGPTGGDVCVVTITRQYLFDDAERAAKWQTKRDRKGWK